MDFQQHEINREWPDEGKISLYREMLRIRKFEQSALRMFVFGKMGGWLLCSIGQESIAASVRSIMSKRDHGISGPRGLGHALAAGMEMKSCMAELYGKATGCSKGKGGMFSMFAPERNHWGCHAMAAGQTPLAAGLAFALKQRDIPGAVVCFLGDGAVNQGVYHESLNLAGLFGLPVVYIIENNGYSMGTSVARSSSFRGSLAQRAEGYFIDWDVFDDADPYEIRAKVHVALERARIERRPSVLEIATYRYYGFTISDANTKTYRTPEEIQEHRSRDPLEKWKDRLLREGIMDPETERRIFFEVTRECSSAVEFAESSAAPRVEDIMEDVYSCPFFRDRGASRGVHHFGG